MSMCIGSHCDRKDTCRRYYAYATEDVQLQDFSTEGHGQCSNGIVTHNFYCGNLGNFAMYEEVNNRE